MYLLRKVSVFFSAFPQLICKGSCMRTAAPLKAADSRQYNPYMLY